jgi:predicted phage terminase large subunit-like protein
VSRGWQLPIRADNRSKGNKEARIQGLSIWFERGVVTFNHRYKNCPDMQAAINQLLAFGEGSRAHDDAPDALEGAIWQLNKRIRRNHIAVTYSVVHRPTMHNLT